MIEDIKSTLANNQDLSQEQMAFFLEAGLKGELTEAEKIEVLSLLNSKGISGRELGAAALYLRHPHVPTDATDLCGTGGSGLDRINTGTIASLVLAAAGVCVAKHGNRAASGRCGSFDLLERLGVKIDLSLEQSESIFDQIGIAFFFAPRCYPQMAAFGTARKAMGVPTIFNLLGPLLSPLNPKRQVIGTTTPEKAKIMLEACRVLGKERLFVVVGDGGLDEVSLTGTSVFYDLENGKSEIHPEDFGFSPVPFTEIAGGDCDTNQQIAEDILSGKDVDSARAKLIYVNVALTLKLMDRESDLKKGAALARELVATGKAKKVLDEIIALSQKA